MKKQFKVSKDYILFPVKTGNKTETVAVYDDTEKIYEFEIPFNENADNNYVYDFQAAVPVKKWKEKEIVVSGNVSEDFLEQISFSDELPLNKEEKPLIHFSANFGWMNDPCGVIYQNGLFHLYYQHNPFDIEWGNMSWGHAVSKDLIHWEHREEALLPDKEGTMFTGSAMINTQGLFGLPEDAHIYVYTSSGGSSNWSKDRKFVQKVAWSVDNGETLHKMDGCIIDHMIGMNRDVKVYWHEEKKFYFAVMFLDGNEYAVLNSKDFVNWEVTQRLNLAPAWECPDLVRVPVEGGGEKWVFWTGDGYYYVGEFDGSVFESNFVLHEAYHTLLPYAAQTFVGVDRIISIPWVRTNNKGKLFRSLMGIPRQLTLVKENDDYVLRMKLVDELEQYRECMVDTKLSCDDACNGCMYYEQKEKAAVELVIVPEKDAGFIAEIYGTKVTYDNKNICIYGIAERSNGVRDAAKLGDKEHISSENQDYRVLELNRIPEKISVLSDGEVLEITIDDGMYGEVYETLADQKQGMISVEAKGSICLNINQIK